MIVNEVASIELDFLKTPAGEVCVANKITSKIEP
jgi:hypothetical protein